ncbi:AAA family ATPase [Micromonospora harpali]|uniref:AAA family ATPase n=1 Tax=Micromonospora harpali TaxID=1490225 RepID=A0ABW1HM46_9ACTN
MRITSLRAENLLSFGQFELAFSSGLNILVGPNGVGKSNVLRLIGLVRAALQVATKHSPDAIDIARYVRLGEGARTGVLSLGVELTEPFEKSLIAGLLRALAVSSVKRDEVQTPAVDSPFEQELDAWARNSVTEAEVDSLLRGRLVLHVEAGPPATWAMAYEFDHQGETYHWGIAGVGLPTGWVASGPTVVTKSSSWGGQAPNLPASLMGPDQTQFTLNHLLPLPGRMTPWEIRSHPSGQRLLGVEELARALDLASQREQIGAVHVFDRILSDSLVITSNLRRPPRTVYDSGETGRPVRLEDAGDLPLELYRRMVSGDRKQRAAYRDVQSLFTRLTGQQVEMRADLIPATANHPAGFEPHMVDNLPQIKPTTVDTRSSHELHIEPLVLTGSGDVSIENAGAGLWEALVVCTAAVQVPGRVVLLDEPAVNLYPSWQRQLLTHLEQLDQVVLVTHSPYLVPARRVADLSTITRLYHEPAGTAASRLADANVPDEWRDRWRQFFVLSADARAALLAQGVILLEGDTELGVFGAWFADPAATGDSASTPDSLNYLLLVVGSDSAFGAYVSYLNAVHVPWAIICDGPVLSPKYKTPLLNQLQQANVNLSDHPDVDAPFANWKSFWVDHGVFTTADQFGGVANDKDKSGEIEAFLQRADGDLWRQIQAQFGKSKIRAGLAFAERVNLSAHPDQQREVADIWSAIKRRLDG